MLSCSILLRLNLCCFMMSKKLRRQYRNYKEFQSRLPPSYWLYLSFHCLYLSNRICLCLCPCLCICATSRQASPSHGYSCHLPSRTLCGCLSPCQKWRFISTADAQVVATVWGVWPQWKVGQYSAWAESAILRVDHSEMMMMRIKWRTMKDSRCDGEPCIIAHGQLTSWIKGRLSL